MRVEQLDAMVKGWIVGDFDPVILRSKDVEVAIKHYRCGERDELHHHRIATELTAVVAGDVRMCERNFTAGDVIVLDPGESTTFEALTDATLVVVKTPSVKGDKYPG